MGGAGFGALCFAAAALVYTFADKPLAGFDPDHVAAFLAAAGVLLLAASWIVNEYRASFAEGLRSTAFWGVIVAVGVILFTFRADMFVVLDRIIGEVSPGRTVTNESGEVVVPRRTDGSFTLAGKLKDRDVQFMFDTGASTVVLTAETAASAGFPESSLNYSIPVSTANGRTLAAPITIESMSIGNITERRVRALVVRAGLLQQNLLGMTFLERLASYEVRGNRLILRGRTPRAPA
jgi:aspartyl protease family protein